jgi:serine/threonine-protein kinase HipA
MSRGGKVFYGGELAGHIERRDDGRYRFAYQPEYLARPDARPVSLTLPLRREEFVSPVLFPFFSGLLAEGSLKELQCRIHRIDPDDDFTRLLKTARHDVIGAVTVEEDAP